MIDEQAILEGANTLGRKLREWADAASLDELTAVLRTADGHIAFRIDADRRVWVGTVLFRPEQDITALVNRTDL